MRKLILVAGCPAAGKTTFARALARHLQVPAYYKDTLKELLSQHVSIRSREESRALSDATFALLLHIADTSLQAGQPVILESNFRPEEGAALRALLHQRGAASLGFVFTADIATLYERFTARDQTEDRAAAHKTHGLNTLNDFECAVLPLANFSTGHLTIRVDTTAFEHVDFNTLMQEAEQFLGE